MLKLAQPRALISLREVSNAKALSSNAKSNPKPQCQMFWILSFGIQLTLGFWALSLALLSSKLPEFLVRSDLPFSGKGLG
ncbi:MAG: hypothetical protein P8175_00745 [Deltaproteobacteria bacterium]